MIKFNVHKVSRLLQGDLQYKIDTKTKPTGSLGHLEKIALQIGLIQNTLTPELINPHIIVFAGDHGIAKEGVSAYPQEVTHQMVLNFVNGGAAINVFCKQNGIKLKVIDAGVNYIFPSGIDVTNAKIGMGTRSFLTNPAMNFDEVQRCLEKGSTIVNTIHQAGCNIIGFGEMGIGNTTSASALMSIMCKMPVEECVGKGTGLNQADLQNKIDIIKKAFSNNGISDSPIQTLAMYGGFEIAQMCGAMMQAAEKRMIILVDGFISTAAFLVAYKINPAIIDYAIFCHQSDEQGHGKMLRYMNVSPVLHLGMRLGEGTGAAISYPIIQSAVNFLNEMATFETAGVSNKEELQYS